MAAKFKIKMKTDDLAAARKELLAKIENHEALQRILRALEVDAETVSENIGLLTDYLISLDEVEACKKAGKCLQNGAYHAYSISFDNNHLSIAPESCPVFFKAQKSQMRYIYRDFPDEYLALRVKDIPARAGFAGYLRELVSFYQGESALIFASAPSGIGALRYALSFFNQILEEKDEVTGGVVDYQAFIRENASDYYKQKEELDQHLAQLQKLDYLLIHNFGNEEINKLVRDAFTFPLLNERIKQKKPTIILSELTLNDIRYLHDYTGKDVRIRQIIEAIRKNIKEEFILTGTKL